MAINNKTAEVYLAQKLDFESLISKSDTTAIFGVLKFKVFVQDKNGRNASTQLELYITGIDEYAPTFKKLSYTFQVLLILKKCK